MITQLSIGAAIPQDIFDETWTLPPHIAFAVANLANLLDSHEVAVNDLAFEVLTLDADGKSKQLQRLLTSLDMISQFALEIESYCGTVGAHVFSVRNRQIWFRNLLSKLTRTLGR
jgi:hypothetical protein